MKKILNLRNAFIEMLLQNDFTRGLFHASPWERIATALIIISASVMLSFTNDNKTKPSFGVIEMEYMEKLNGFKVCWEYNVPALMDVSVYVGDSLQKQLVFSGKIQGTGNICQITNLGASKKDNFFVDITDMRGKKVLFSQKLENEIISVNGKPKKYILYSRKK